MMKELDVDAYEYRLGTHVGEDRPANPLLSRKVSFSLKPSGAS
jgi:hypothetical protein